MCGILLLLGQSIDKIERGDGGKSRTRDTHPHTHTGKKVADRMGSRSKCLQDKLKILHVFRRHAVPGDLSELKILLFCEASFLFSRFGIIFDPES